MYSLDNIVMMYFSSVPAQRILNGEIHYDRFPEHEFAQLSKAYLTRYSDTENRSLYHYIEGSVSEEGHPFAGMDGRSGLNVFAALEELAEQLLIMEENEVLCIYGNLLRLREITRYVEEDLLVCAYLTIYTRRFGMGYTDFSWNTTIGHNNVQLNHIMERGLSENHFHLYGSAPAFHLIWIHFMNHVDDSAIYGISKEAARTQRMTRNHYNAQYKEERIAVNILKAALIRVHIVQYLLFRLRGEQVRSSDYDMRILLSGGEDIQAYYGILQGEIDKIRNEALLAGQGDLIDYALYAAENQGNKNTENLWFAGERWIMYKMLAGELAGDAEKEGNKDYYQWFYAYLALKQNLRGEILQINDTVGFENFAIYSKRKNVYTDSVKMIETAIYGSVASGNIKSLEIRVSPKKDVCENVRLLRGIEAAIQNRENPFPKEKYYYVFHFSKKNDEPLAKRECFGGCYCRHYKLRLQLLKQAVAIRNLREYYQEEACRVRGIDACAQEIGCRPEVFATVFRFLCNHVAMKNVRTDSDIEIAQLKMTYHVGEDFLDVVDGLRAVGEAIHFLNLRCGDRIGHGTVLGIDVRKWYEFKQYTIVLSRQDYLDNVVWLYHKLAEYKLDGYGCLRAELEKEFGFYFAEIYLHMEDGSIRELADSNIYTYYEAWKLRGDAPELYQNGYYDKSRIYDRDWFVNRHFPKRTENRDREEVAYLYYLYHFDWDVRRNGQKSEQIHLSPIYVEGVQAVQKAMQRAFAALGIGIETNPSSNLAISTIGNYDEHPIVAMYNKDITWNAEQLQECPQLYVSINTDDKGVFHTSLENEYALMACSMEKKKDEKGFPLYNRQMVYQWIDNIREMGNLQSFRDAKGGKRD